MSVVVSEVEPLIRYKNYISASGVGLLTDLGLALSLLSRE